MTAYTLSLDAFAMKILHRIAPGTQGRLHVSYGIMASFQTSEPFLLRNIYFVSTFKGTEGLTWELEFHALRLGFNSKNNTGTNVD